MKPKTIEEIKEKIKELKTLIKKEKKNGEYTKATKHTYSLNGLLLEKNSILNKLKLSKKIETIKKITVKQIEKHKLSLNRKKNLALQKVESDINLRLEKKQAAFEKKKRGKAKNKIRVILGKKKLKEKKGIRLIKEKAFKEFQLYAKISRADNEGMVLQLDTGKIVHYTECQGGHYFPKHNYPQLAFNINNCRPISPMGNKRQGDQEGLIWKHNLVAIAGFVKFEQLKEISQHKGVKNLKRDYTYYENYYNMYKELNKKELERLK